MTDEKPIVGSPGRKFEMVKPYPMEGNDIMRGRRQKQISYYMGIVSVTALILGNLIWKSLIQVGTVVWAVGIVVGVAGWWNERKGFNDPYQAYQFFHRRAYFALKNSRRYNIEFVENEYMD